MAKARKVLSDPDLIAYSQEHVQYEISMLVACGHLSTRQFRSESTDLATVLHNAILESFAIHLRNVVDFLYPGTSVKVTDVLADDFFLKGNVQSRSRRCPPSCRPPENGHISR